MIVDKEDPMDPLTKLCFYWLCFIDCGLSSVREVSWF